MKFQLEYFEDDQKNVIEAKEWYSNQKNGLEKLWSFSVKEKILLIQKNPYLFDTKYKNIRIAFLSVFPCGIHYYIEDQNKKIIILAIIHTSRNPNNPQKRLISKTKKS